MFVHRLDEAQGYCGGGSVFCAADANTPPRASRSRWLEPGRIAVCGVDGGFAREDCPAGQQCAVAGGVRCVPAVCPPSGESTACVDDRWLGRCRGATEGESTDCQRFGGRRVRGACESPDAGAPDAGTPDAPAVDATVADVALARAALPPLADVRHLAASVKCTH